LPCGKGSVAPLKQTYRRGAQNWRPAFPQLPSSKQWLSRVPQLLPQGGRVVALTGTQTLKAPRRYLIDSNPIPLCLPIRHGRVRVLRDQGAYFGKTSKGWVLGFNLQLLRHGEGRVLNVSLTPGNWADRAPALALVQAVEGGVPRGALGSRGPECAADLAADAEMLLMTRAQAPAHRFVLSPVRQPGETTFSQVWRQFVDRGFSRSWTGVWHTLHLKVLSYNLRPARLLSTCANSGLRFTH
jgi:DDE family transposase